MLRVESKILPCSPQKVPCTIGRRFCAGKTNLKMMKIQQCQRCHHNQKDQSPVSNTLQRGGTYASRGGTQSDQKGDTPLLRGKTESLGVI